MLFQRVLLKQYQLSWTPKEVGDIWASDWKFTISHPSAFIS